MLLKRRHASHHGGVARNHVHWPGSRAQGLGFRVCFFLGGAPWLESDLLVGLWSEEFLAQGVLAIAHLNLITLYTPKNLRP